MTTTAQLVTAEQLLAMPHDQPCELVAGEIVKMTPTGYEHGKIELTIGSLLRAYAVRTNAGDVLSGDVGFILARDPDTVLGPDIAFVRRGREPESPQTYFAGPPDLAVEVVSPNDSAQEVADKTKLWLEAGTPLLWVVWPETRSVTVHRPGQPRRILHEQDPISGEDVLPGFECRVAEFFA